MKIQQLIAPILALAGSGYWLSQQNSTIRELTEKNRIIRERVVLVEKASSEATSSFKTPKNGNQHDEFTLPDGSPDWKLIAEMMTESINPSGMPTNMKALLKLQTKLVELSDDELITGLKKIATLDLDPKKTGMLKQGILSLLAEKNPQAALAALSDPITSQSDSSFWLQTQIISKLAQEDPNFAIAWIDEKVAAGKLTSTSLNQYRNPRLQLESPIIRALLSSDYPAAAARFGEFSDDEKFFLLTNSHQHLEGDSAKNLIRLARENLPADKASEAISTAIGNQPIAELSSISEAVKDIPLSESEKTEVLQNLIRSYSHNNTSESKFEDLYQWSKTEAPGQEADLVATALNSGFSNFDKPQNSFETALQVSESLGTPEILTSFVAQTSNNGNQEIVSRLLNQFDDPKLAAQYRILAENLTPNQSEPE